MAPELLQHPTAHRSSGDLLLPCQGLNLPLCFAGDPAAASYLVEALWKLNRKQEAATHWQKFSQSSSSESGKGRCVERCVGISSGYTLQFQLQSLFQAVVSDELAPHVCLEGQWAVAVQALSGYQKGDLGQKGGWRQETQLRTL